MGHAKNAGRAYVFTKTASRWKEIVELKGSDTGPRNWFGSSVAIWGATAVVGALQFSNYVGRAYVFEA